MSPSTIAPDNRRAMLRLLRRRRRSISILPRRVKHDHLAANGGGLLVNSYQYTPFNKSQSSLEVALLCNTHSYNIAP
jgi:hypothetical protein